MEGEYVIFIDGREFRCPSGSFTFIPAGIPHGFRVGAVASRKLNLFAPAAMVGYFDELAEATRRDDVDAPALSEIALRYSMEVIGPVPEGYVWPAGYDRRSPRPERSSLAVKNRNSSSGTAVMV